MTKKSEIKHGDLVMVAGYIDRLFFVDGWTVEHNYTPEATWTEKWFDVTCAHTGEYHMAEASEVTRVCGADQADDYLMYHTAPMPKFDVGKLTINFDINEYRKEDAEMNRKPTQRELSSQEAERRKQARKERAGQIDNLLDIRNWNAAKYEKTSERAYRMKVEEIDAELAKLAAEGRRQYDE